MIAAQVNDLAGKPAEAGTVEEWWVSPRQYRIEMSGPWGKSVETSDDDVLGGTALGQSGFLLEELRKHVIDPLSPLSESASIGVQDRSMEGKRFHCLAVDPSGKSSRPVLPPVYCAEMDQPNVRLVFPREAETIVRNGMARFRAVNIAMATTIDLGHAIAISGQITTLQSFDPTASSFPELREAKRAGNKGPDEEGDLFPATVQAGHLLTKIDPIYPEGAKAGHIAGSVFIAAVITHEGRLRSLEVLASPNPLLTEAALQAVRDARYTAFLLSGRPVEVTTVIVLSFHLS